MRFACVPSRSACPTPALSRRHFLQLMAAASALALQPKLLARAVAGISSGAALSPFGFLGAEELAILDAASSLILPTDDRPGAREIGVVDYVQSLLSFLPGSDANCDRQVSVADLTAVERKALGQFLGCPPGGDVNGDGAVDRADLDAAAAAAFRARPMFAGGPFSGRNPQPHFPIGATPCRSCHGVNADASATAGGAGGATVDVYPPNAFRQFLPMNRLQTLSWKVRLLGPREVPEVAENQALAAFAAQLPEVDLRNRYRQGLAALEAASQSPPYEQRFVDLTPEERREVLQQADPRFIDLLTRHVIQGTLCAPEYGGNRDRLGWQLAGFDGDSQPLGYEIYDESAPGFYRERVDQPNSRPDPGEQCNEFSDNMKRFLDFISRAAGGGPLDEPGCLELDG